MWVCPAGEEEERKDRRINKTYSGVHFSTSPTIDVPSRPHVYIVEPVKLTGRGDMKKAKINKTYSEVYFPFPQTIDVPSGPRGLTFIL